MVGGWGGGRMYLGRWMQVTGTGTRKPFMSSGMRKLGSDQTVGFRAMDNV